MTTLSTDAPREVTDEELAAEAARVRRHMWRERGAMGAGMVLGFAGFAAWMATSMVLLFVVGLLLGGALYRTLGPRGGPLDDPPGPKDPEAVAALRRMSPGSGALAWFGSHLMVKAIVTVTAVGGLLLGFLFPGKLLGQSMHDPLRGLLWGAAIGSAVFGLLGYLGGRALSRKVFGRTRHPLA